MYATFCGSRQHFATTVPSLSQDGHVIEAPGAECWSIAGVRARHGHTTSMLTFRRKAKESEGKWREVKLQNQFVEVE